MLGSKVAGQGLGQRLGLANGFCESSPKSSPAAKGAERRYPPCPLHRLQHFLGVDVLFHSIGRAEKTSEVSEDFGSLRYGHFAALPFSSPITVLPVSTRGKENAPRMSPFLRSVWQSMHCSVARRAPSMRITLPRVRMNRSLPSVNSATPVDSKTSRGRVASLTDG